MLSQVQASEMRCLRRIEGVTLFNKVRSSEIRKSLNIEPLLLRIERSQLRWFGHVSRMPQERLPKQALLAKANGRRPVGRPRTRWTDYIEDLGWNRSGLRPNKMIDVVEDREVWRLNLELLPNPHGKAGNEERRRRKKKLTTIMHLRFYDKSRLLPHGPISSKFSLHINQKEISKSESVKYLGVWFDDRLNRSAHIQKLLLQLAKRCNKLYHIPVRDLVNSHALVTLYYSFVHSRLTCGITAWGTAAPNQLPQIEFKQ